MHINLLPLSFAWQRRQTRRIRQWGCVAAALCILVVCWNVRLLNRWYSLSIELRELSHATEPVQKLQSDRLQVSRETVRLEEKARELKSIVASDRTPAILGILSQGTAATSNDIQIQNMQLTLAENSVQPNRESKRNDDSKPPPVRTQISLQGIASDSQAITSFVEYLQNTSLFPSVELRSTQERLISDRMVREFRLECSTHD